MGHLYMKILVKRHVQRKQSEVTGYKMDSACPLKVKRIKLKVPQLYESPTLQLIKKVWSRG